MRGFQTTTTINNNNKQINEKTLLRYYTYNKQYILLQRHNTRLFLRKTIDLSHSNGQKRLTDMHTQPRVQVVDRSVKFWRKQKLKNEGGSEYQTDSTLESQNSHERIHTRVGIYERTRKLRVLIECQTVLGTLVE